MPTVSAQTWCRQDPNSTTRRYVQELLDNNDSNAISRLFPDDRIAFGTAGLRACMQPGPVGMNDLIVIQTAQGLAKHIQATQQQKSIVVVGYDHRANNDLNISSKSFALWTALVLIQAGIECVLLHGFVATPLVPFVMKYYNEITSTNANNKTVAAGIMITASHNPKQDNGYKVYDKDACQIRSPVDKQIAESITNNLEPWIDYAAALEERMQQYPDNTNLYGLSDPQQTEKFKDAYFEALSSRLKVDIKLPSSSNDSSRLQPKFCYTAMHGVGHDFAKRSLGIFSPSFTLYSVPSQQDPDPNFPTVDFPNPEERGALDLAQDYANQQGCNIILANDPDADRLAIAEKNNDTWHTFTGNQIGVMLGHWMWTQYKGKNAAMCASTVSSQMLRAIAQTEGFYFCDTLTGFKWIGSGAAQLQEQDYDVLFCYEEAIGFCCGNVIFDKDGISALGVASQLATHVYCNLDMTLHDYMQSLYDKYGEFVSYNGYYKIDLTIVPQLVQCLTRNLDWASFFDNGVAGYKVTSLRYLGEPGAYDSSTSDNKPTLPTSKSSPLFTLRFENGCVAHFRASGTEPKFKYYIELQGQAGVARDVVAKDVKEMAEMILQELLQPDKFGLQSSM